MSFIMAKCAGKQLLVLVIIIGRTQIGHRWYGGLCEMIPVCYVILWCWFVSDTAGLSNDYTCYRLRLAYQVYYIPLRTTIFFQGLLGLIEFRHIDSTFFFIFSLGSAVYQSSTV